MLVIGLPDSFYALCTAVGFYFVISSTLLWKLAVVFF